MRESDQIHQQIVLAPTSREINETIFVPTEWRDTVPPYFNYSLNSTFYNSNVFLYENFETEEVVYESLNIWWALLASMLVLFTACGNVLVCLAIYWERRLQNVTNYFLMSLAITDLLVAILVMPLGILTLVRGMYSFTFLV